MVSSILHGYIRQFLIQRCTIQRTADSTEDPSGALVPGDYSTYLTNQPCRWWTEIGRGETNEASRDAVMDTARLLMKGTQDVRESDRITDITTRDGTVIDNGVWEIKVITSRAGEGAKLLMLERVR